MKIPEPKSLFPSRIDVHLHSDVAPPTQSILSALHTLTERIEQMAALLDDVVQKTTATHGKLQSLIVFVKALSDKLEAAKQDPVKIQAIADELDTMGAEVDAAVNANSA